MVSPVEQSESNLGPVTIFRLPPAGVALLARPPFWTKSRYELEEVRRAVNTKGAGGSLETVLGLTVTLFSEKMLISTSCI